MNIKTLIGHLEKLPQDVEIYLWNGMVGDIVPVSDNVLTTLLYKHSIVFLKTELDRNWSFDNNIKDIPKEVQDEHLKIAKEQYEKSEYNLPNTYVTKEEYSRWYDEEPKKIVVLEAQLTGRTYQDRLGAIEY
jgi:hypothetical protein